MARRLGLLVVVAYVMTIGCAAETVPTIGSPADTTTPGAIMRISSPAFDPDTPIPDRYTCAGEDINPPLEISNAPDGTESLVLIVDDPDAPAVIWEHWIVWNIDPATSVIPAGEVPAGAVQGTNSWVRTGYGGPCPPSGTHRYFFKLYALDTTLALGTTSIKADVEAAMHGHVLARADLIGLYGG